MQLDDIHFGENLNRLRTDKGITVERLADKSGVSVATIKSAIRSHNSTLPLVAPWTSCAASQVSIPRLMRLRSWLVSKPKSTSSLRRDIAKSAPHLRCTFFA